MAADEPAPCRRAIVGDGERPNNKGGQGAGTPEAMGEVSTKWRRDDLLPGRWCLRAGKRSGRL